MSRTLQVPEDLLEFTSFGSPINLYDGATAKKRPAFLLRIVAGSGTVTVKMAGSNGTNRVLTMAAGEEQLGMFMSIEAVTGVTIVRVGWN